MFAARSSGRSRTNEPRSASRTGLRERGVLDLLVRAGFPRGDGSAAAGGVDPAGRVAARGRARGPRQRDAEADVPGLRDPGPGPEARRVPRPVMTGRPVRRLSGCRHAAALPPDRRDPLDGRRPRRVHRGRLEQAVTRQLGGAGGRRADSTIIRTFSSVEAVAVVVYTTGSRLGTAHDTGRRRPRQAVPFTPPGARRVVRGHDPRSRWCTVHRSEPGRDATGPARSSTACATRPPP